MTGGNRKKRKAKRVRFQALDELSSNELCDEDDDDNICRCICGDNDFTAKRPWIQCTDCEAWQHNDCMDVSVFDDELGDHYWCEECAPERHVELLAAVERGERPWKVRIAHRLNLKQQFESRIEVVLEQLDWLWQLYAPQPKAVAGNDSAVPPNQMAPKSYVDAVQVGLKTLFEDLPMQSLGDLAQHLTPVDGKHRVMRLLRKKVAMEYDESDIHSLGILSELFGWSEKGTFHDGEITTKGAVSE